MKNDETLSQAVAALKHTAFETMCRLEAAHRLTRVLEEWGLHQVVEDAMGSASELDQGLGDLGRRLAEEGWPKGQEVHEEVAHDA